MHPNVAQNQAHWFTHTYGSHESIPFLLIWQLIYRTYTHASMVDIAYTYSSPSRCAEHPAPFRPHRISQLVQAGLAGALPVCNGG